MTAKPVDLTTLAAGVSLPLDHPLLNDPQYFVPDGPEPFSPERAMYLLWWLGGRINDMENLLLNSAKDANNA
jgi:hypothetical protein